MLCTSQLYRRSWITRFSPSWVERMKNVMTWCPMWRVTTSLPPVQQMAYSIFLCQCVLRNVTMLVSLWKWFNCRQSWSVAISCSTFWRYWLQCHKCKVSTLSFFPSDNQHSEKNSNYIVWYATRTLYTMSAQQLLISMLALIQHGESLLKWESIEDLYNQVSYRYLYMCCM